jgi:hypothetical protein
MFLLLSFVVTSKASELYLTDAIFCESSRWDGSSVDIEEDVVDISENGIFLKSVLYEYSRNEKKVIKISYDGNSLKFYNMHYFENSTRYYFVVAYEYGGVLTMDTIFSDGQVFSQYSKLSIGIFPTADTFAKKCVHK